MVLQAQRPWGAEASTELLASACADVDELAEWVTVDYCQAARKTLAFLPPQAKPCLESQHAEQRRCDGLFQQR